MNANDDSEEGASQSRLETFDARCDDGKSRNHPEVIPMDLVSGVIVEENCHSQLQKNRKCLSLLSLSTMIVGLCLLTYFGVALRISIIKFFNIAQPDSFLYPVTWANFLGCFVMGILVDHKTALTKCYNPLNVALLTGFCGSLTSFSTVIVHGCLLAFSPNDCSVTIHHRILLFLENCFFNFTISFVVFKYGQKLSQRAGIKMVFDKMSSTRSSYCEITVNVTLVICYAFLTLVVILLSILKSSSQEFTIPIIMGQFGSVIRYFLGKYFNSFVPRFPVGTFIANVLGSVISAVTSSVTLYLSNSFHDTPFALIIFSGISSGFCGSLTTVSTFVNEIASLPSIKTSLFYAAASISSAQLLAFLPYVLFHIFVNQSMPLYCDA